MTSGDIDPDTGDVIMHRDSPERIYQANDYSVIDGDSQYVLNVPITLDDGFPEIDMYTPGALCAGSVVLDEGDGLLGCSSRYSGERAAVGDPSTG